MRAVTTDVGDGMLAVIKLPGQEPEMREIDNSLSALQAIVEGYIECVNIGSTIVAVMNEEGRLRGMSSNVLGFVGPLVFVGRAGDEFRSLTEDEADFLMDSL